jgi:diguanylate cyclase (GGDEF)-like protein
MCGQYDLTAFAGASMRHRSTVDRRRLSGVIRNAWESGERLQLDENAITKLIASAPRPTPVECRDLVLEYIARKAGERREAVRLDPNRDYPLVYGQAEADLAFVLEALLDERLISHQGPEGAPYYGLTMAGYQYLEARRNPKREDEPAAADIDGLTGLLRREAFDRDIPKMLEAAKSDGAPLALVMVDLDHFKRVNDTHGHPKGDAVLRGVAEHIARAAKHKGRAYRYGGEEMAVLLPNHTVDEAVAVAERARVAIDSALVADVRVAASFGVACYPEHAEPESLKEAADKALYDAKHQGRNCVRFFGEPPPAAPGPRVTPRRQPEPGGLTDEQREKMRQDHFRGVQIKCPRDQAVLKVEEDRAIGQLGGLFVYCPVCGLNEDLPGVRPG